MALTTYTLSEDVHTISLAVVDARGGVCTDGVRYRWAAAPR